MTYILKKIVNTLKNLPSYQILHIAADYLIVGTQITLQGKVEVEGEQKYCFQPYTFLDITDASVTVGTKITLEDAVDFEIDDPAYLQLDISTQTKTLPIYFNIGTKNEISIPNNAPYFTVTNTKNFETELEFFIKKTFLNYAS